jgi:hypothetical protein
MVFKPAVKRLSTLTGVRARKFTHGMVLAGHSDLEHGRSVPHLFIDDGVKRERLIFRRGNGMHQEFA